MNNLNLITKNRIDIVIGIEYVDFYENQYNTDFFIDLHINYKRSFNDLKEKGCVGKQKHLERFNNIIDGIKDKQTNTVKINVYKFKNEYWVRNGFHRTSVLSYYNLNKNLGIKSIKTYPCRKTYWFYPTNIYLFKKRKYPLKYCNYTMYSFLKNYHKNFSCIVLFPNNKNLPSDLLNIVRTHIIYDIDISVNHFKNNFKNNFIQILYYTEGWCKNGEYKEKARECFTHRNNLTIYFIEKQEYSILLDFKKSIRKYYNKGNNSIHIPDKQKECDTLLDLLNSNTLSFIDKAPTLYINFPNFNKLFDKLKKYCKDNNIDTKKICITHLAVLSVYGIRDCNKIELCIDKKYVDMFKHTDFDVHNQYTIEQHYSKHFDDIIYNPDNHFYFKGIKFCNLSIILDYKKYRVKNTLYDENIIKQDIRDINSIIEISNKN